MAGRRYQLLADADCNEVVLAGNRASTPILTLVYSVIQAMRSGREPSRPIHRQVVDPCTKLGAADHGSANCRMPFCSGAYANFFFIEHGIDGLPAVRAALPLEDSAIGPGNQHT